MARRLTLAALALLASLAGCATGGPDRKALDDTLDVYAVAIRWGELDTAIGLIDPEVRDTAGPSRLDRERLEQMQVTGYEVLRAGTIGERYQQVVQVRLVNRHTQRERTVTDAQEWRWDPQAKRWWLRSGLPDITAAR